MRRSRLILPAVLLGTVVAVAVATSASDPGGGAGSTGVVVKAPAAPPLIPVGPPQAQAPNPPIGRALPLGKGGEVAIPGTTGMAVTAADPTGGPRWAVRTFQRRGGRGGRVWCAQLGREVRGQFVWILPGEQEAGRVLARASETTVCATTAPISERLGVMVGSFADRDQRDPEARIAATVIWGVVDVPVAAARFDHAGQRHRVQPRRHGVLKVLPGTAMATRARLVVRDRGGGRRTAIPPAFFDVQGGGRVVSHVPSPNVAEPTQLRALIRVAAGADGRPKGIFMRDARPGLPACFAGPTLMVAGRAAAQLDRRSGLVRQPQQPCQPVPPRAASELVPMGSGWTSGDPLLAGTREARDAERRRNERRIQYGSGGVLMVAPPGVALIEVRSPVGVKTVRVNRERVAWIGWDGQPEVQRAMFPPFPGTQAWEREIKTGHTPVEFRGLDARGRQVGPTVYQGKVSYTPEEIRRGRAFAREREQARRAFERDRAERERRAIESRLLGTRTTR